MAGIWTRNYYNILTAQLLCDDALASTAAPSDYNPPVRVRLQSGSYSNIVASNIITSESVDQVKKSVIPPFLKGSTYNATNVRLRNASTPYGAGGLVIAVGSGSTPASYEDYTLGSEILYNLSLASSTGVRTQATTYNAETHHISSKRTYTITATAHVVVNEIGLFVGVTDYNEACMIYREVFDEPITLENGESLLVTFNRDAEVFNYIPY